jgi:pimeloyl-ACP methyl ester carboxylesterase
MGAAAALVLAGTYPDVPGAILLEDPPAWWIEWSESAMARERMAEMRARFRAFKSQSRDALVAESRTQHPTWSEAEHEPWAAAKQRANLAVLEVTMHDYPRGVDWPAVLSRITCPALLITGDPAHDAIVTTESAAALRDLIPHLDIAHVPDAGHSIRRDQFESYMNAVTRFLAERYLVAA